MTTIGALHGSLAHVEKPDWAPLLSMLGERLAGWFMWMCEVELDNGTRLHAYKHVTTPQYLHIDAGGQAFEYRPERHYLQIPASGAVAQTFVGWEPGEPSDREVAELRSVVRRLQAP